MGSVTILAILGILGLLWLKFKSFFLGKKVSSAQKDLREKKDEANKKLGAADAANAEFQRKLQEYRDKKSSK